jgi:hypothetical protein
MPRSTLRHHLPSTLPGLALGLWALSIGAFAASAPSSATADQSGAANANAMPEVSVIARMDKHTLNRVVNQFIQSHAQPSAIIGQVGRWRENVCPAVLGLKSSYAGALATRITTLARSVGAPASAEGKKCTANVDIVFTPEPQALLDLVAKKYRPLLGYYPKAEVKQATTFNHPVQAWYETGTRALDYQPPIIMPSTAGGMSAVLGPPQSAPAILPFITGLEIDSSETSGESGNGLGPTGTAGSRLTRGLRSEFVHVLIIVDSKTVETYSLQTVSDYIALLALTRIASPDTCSALPTILNLFAAGCPAPPTGITTPDTAYLKALYAANLDKNLNIEQGEMRDRMVEVISTK